MAARSRGADVEMTPADPVPRLPTAKLARVQLADQVVGHLRSLIAEGALREGDRLPSETTLSRELEVSRSTVREALRVLGHLGLIETRQGSGSYVTGQPADVATSTEPATAAELFELFEFRLALESEIAQLAAQRRTPAQLQRILAALEKLHDAAEAGSSPEMSAADRDLHLSIAAASNNRYLHEVYETYQPTFATAADQLIGMQEPSHIRDLHDELVDAVSVKDVRAAAAAVRRTFDEIRMRLKLLT